MIEHEHRIAAGEALDALDRDRNARCKKEEARELSHDRPPPFQPRQDHDQKPADRAGEDNHGPPPRRIEHVADKAAEAGDPRADAGEPEASELPPHGALPRTELAAL